MKIKFVLFIIAISNSLLIYGIKPVKEYRNKPTEFKLNYEEFVIKTPDGVSLKLWLIQPTEKKANNKVIVFAYGDSGNMSYWLHHAQLFSENGFTIVLFDYRGFGESSTFEINTDLLYYNEFSTDLVSVIKWTKHKFAGQRIGVYGFSMGTISAAAALQNEKVDFFIAESAIYNPEDVVNYLHNTKHKTILLPVGSNNVKGLYNNISCSMLLLSGVSDEVSSPQTGKLIANQKSNRKLVTYSGGHGQALQSLGKEYGKIISDFIE
ncbi:MAG TPA: alpha/beta fold hydrolase [Prolixibacteraceae bacterium]|nr:alpha/beta fold hydrolase [Prolixibacteraceae bacterium]